MRFTVITLFPEMFESFLDASLLGKARERGLIEVAFVDPRTHTSDVHRTVDDSPYGGGAGMVMKVEPMIAAIEEAAGGGGHRVLLAPAGAPLDQERVAGLAARQHVILVCGRYEGPDERIAELAIDESISIGDYVLSGGEVAAMTIIDAVSRLVPGVLGKMASTEDESFSPSTGGLLEYPQYTRPLEFRGREVPEVLRSGNHERIRQWRRARSLERTRQRRPDIYRRHAFTDEDRTLDAQTRLGADRTYAVLCHHPVLDRLGDIVTSSVTNLDIHDVARTATTLGLAGYLAVSPVAAQREKITGIVETWRRLATTDIGDNRHQALSILEASPSLEAAAQTVAERHDGRRPLVVATTARIENISDDERLRSFEALGGELLETDGPVLLVFGTGWGLAPSALALADRILEPVQGAGEFNHLAVRSAIAIILDRLFGARATS